MVVRREEYGRPLFIPIRELDEFEAMMDAEANDPTGTVFKEVVERWGNEDEVTRREILLRISFAWNQCESLQSQMVLLKHLRELKINGSKVNSDFKEIKFNDLWLN